MLNLAPRDRYTALPSRARFRARSQDARPSLRPTKGGGASRDVLLGKLVDSVTGEDEAIQSLLHTFGLDDEHNSAAQDWMSQVDRSKPRPSTKTTVNEPWADSLGIMDKNQYLLTPIRTRLFPKASPGVLRNILRTPSLRAFTPDQSVLPEDSSLLGPPLQSMIDAALAEAAESWIRSKDTCDSDDLLANDQSAAFPPCPGSRFLLPSPPPSTELPSLESFCPPGPAAESSPANHLEFHDAKRRSPSLDSRRSSSQGRRSPFLELIPSGLRAVPCRPLLNTRPAVHDKSPALSSVPTARAARASDRRGAEHAHRGLAFGVVRDFQRVLDELQGLGHNASASVDDRSDAEPFAVAQAPSPSLDANTASRDLHCGAPARRPFDTSMAATQAQRAPLTDRKDAPPRHPAPDSFPSGGTLLGHMGDRSQAYRRASQASSAPSTPCNGLEDEFISLLLSQAAEEEAQAELLRTIADRLGNIANRKRHLARTMTTR